MASNNHVSFSDEAGPSRQPYVHPERLISGVHTPVEPKKKVKSENQKRYEKKKEKKRKKVLAAKKAAAPKNKSWKPDPVAEALRKATLISNGPKLEDDAGGLHRSNTEEPATSKDIEPQAVKEKVKSKKGKREKKEKKSDGKSEAERDGEDSEAEKEKRRREKREKREKRDRKERRRIEREEKEKAIEFASRAADGAMDIDGADSTPIADGSRTSEGEDDSDAEQNTALVEDMTGGADDDAHVAAPNRSPSPPPLQAFPLPRAAPAPDAAVLARQGLPAGLEDAVFVDQDLRVKVDELEVPNVIGRDGGLSERMKGRLKDIGVEEFFAVQAAILPHLLQLRLVPFPYSELNDYLISAPTGSGKTLAYAVPIVEILSKRIVTRLRALIVLPTRDLVIQVRETLEELAKGTGLNIGAVTGQHSFTQEQSQLVADLETPLLGGSSKLDILIATPGRLMDHLASTPNFTLQHLRFLVIDEADRLLNQSFQDWLAQVLSYTRPPTQPIEQKPEFVRQPYDAVAPAWLEAFGLRERDAEWMFRPRNICQKLLFSATLTRDPSKVAALSLTSPQYYIVQSTVLPNEPVYIGEQFAFPTSLSEKMLILPPALKPLNLIHLIHDNQFKVHNALVFTKSVESAARLIKLLEFFEDAYTLGGGGGGRVVVKGYTGDMKPNERKRMLAEFSEGKINLLVCSDLIARGMDLPTVSNVVSYDIPIDMRKYVHRVGRTARAGREGTAWTLVEKQEALHFKGMMTTAGHLKSIKKVKVQEESLAGYRESYDIAMKRLKDHYGRDA